MASRFRRRFAPFAVLAGLAGLLAGCFGDGDLARGRVAERNGEYDKAYRIYCEAASRHPTGGSTCAALARVSPLAAQTWLGRGERCELRDEHALAWRCYMTALSIRPDNSRALAGVRRLERSDPDGVADAREAFLRQGERALPVAEAAIEATAGAAPTATDIASSPRARGTSDPGRRDSRAASRGPARAEEPNLSGRSGSRRVASPPATAGSSTAPASVGVREADATPPGLTPAGVRGYLTIAVISREDERFSRTATLVDGIRVRVLDTDPEPDADVAVGLGAQDERRVRNWRPGGVVRFRGRSGRLYDLILLGIRDDTESVKIGIREAFPPPPTAP